MAEKINRRGRNYTSGSAIDKTLRQAIVEEILTQGGDARTRQFPGTYIGVAERHRVSTQTVKNIWERYCDSGSCSPKPHAGGRQKKLGPSDLAFIRELKCRAPSITYAQIQKCLMVKNGKGRKRLMERLLSSTGGKITSERSNETITCFEESDNVRDEEVSLSYKELSKHECTDRRNNVQINLGELTPVDLTANRNGEIKREILDDDFSMDIVIRRPGEESTEITANTAKTYDIHQQTFIDGNDFKNEFGGSDQAEDGIDDVEDFYLPGEKISTSTICRAVKGLSLPPSRKSDLASKNGYNPIKLMESLRKSMNKPKTLSKISKSPQSEDLTLNGRIKKCPPQKSASSDRDLRLRCDTNVIESRDARTQKIIGQGMSENPDQKIRHGSFHPIDRNLDNGLYPESFSNAYASGLEPSNIIKCDQYLKALYLSGHEKNRFNAYPSMIPQFQYPSSDGGLNDLWLQYYSNMVDPYLYANALTSQNPYHIPLLNSLPEVTEPKKDHSISTLLDKSKVYDYHESESESEKSNNNLKKKDAIKLGSRVNDELLVDSTTEELSEMNGSLPAANKNNMLTQLLNKPEQSLSYNDQYNNHGFWLNYVISNWFYNQNYSNNFDRNLGTEKRDIIGIPNSNRVAPENINSNLTPTQNSKRVKSAKPPSPKNGFKKFATTQREMTGPAVTDSSRLEENSHIMKLLSSSNLATQFNFTPSKQSWAKGDTLHQTEYDKNRDFDLTKEIRRSLSNTKSNVRDINDEALDSNQEDKIPDATGRNTAGAILEEIDLKFRLGNGRPNNLDDEQKDNASNDYQVRVNPDNLISINNDLKVSASRKTEDVKEIFKKPIRLRYRDWIKSKAENGSISHSPNSKDINTHPKSIGQNLPKSVKDSDSKKVPVEENIPSKIPDKRQFAKSHSDMIWEYLLKANHGVHSFPSDQPLDYSCKSKNHLINAAGN
ncbi:unnamed protein product [Gordionus sp. m RMFG-2023]